MELEDNNQLTLPPTNENDIEINEVAQVDDNDDLLGNDTSDTPDGNSENSGKNKLNIFHISDPYLIYTNYFLFITDLPEAFNNPNNEVPNNYLNHEHEDENAPSSEDEVVVRENAPGSEHKDDDDDPEQENTEIPQTYHDLTKHLAHLWTEATAKHNISVEGASKLWRLAFKWTEKIFQKKEEERITTKSPQFKHLRKKVMNSVPPVNIRLAYLNLETKEVEHPDPSEVAPHKAYSDVKKYKKLYEISTVKIRDVLKIHRDACKSHQNHLENQIQLNLSCDGVADSKSSAVSMDVFSVSFPECSTVYPICTIRPTKKSSVDFQSELKLILEDLKNNNVKIINVLADNPMRALMRYFKNHSSYFSCEYCRSSAEYYQDLASKKKLEEFVKKTLKKTDALKKEIETLQMRKGSTKKKNADKRRIQSLRQDLANEEKELQEMKKKLSKKVRLLYIYIYKYIYENYFI